MELLIDVFNNARDIFIYTHPHNVSMSNEVVSFYGYDIEDKLISVN